MGLVGTIERSGAAHPDVLKSWAPANGTLLGEVSITQPAEVTAIVARARRAQSAWGLLTVEERSERLLRLRDVLVERAEELVDVISAECGKPRGEALTHEVAVTVDLLSYYTKNARRILAPKELGLHLLMHKASTVHYVPRGVIGVIAPWNFPFVIPMGDVVAALVTGSAVVVKPSEVTPLTMRKAKELFDASGLPQDLLGVVYGRAATGEALIASGIQKLIFTGAVETGRKVASLCGQHLVPCVMELGGKAPLIACADCDVERTARAIVFGGFVNAGQACVSVERVYAHADVHDALVTRVRDLTQGLRVGDPTGDDEMDVDVGAVTFPRQLDVARKHIEDALAKGAELVCGGTTPAGDGQFLTPTVLANCDGGMTVMREEIFGPVVPIQKVADDEEAVRLANDSPLGLNAYVFTSDRARGQALARRIEAGSVVVNDVVVNYAVAEAPFGGIKNSGFGKVHGDDALRAMASERHVLRSRVPEPANDPLWFPYSKKVYRFQLRAFRALFSRGSVFARLGKLF